MNKYSFKELEDIIEENSFIAIDYILQALSMCKKANTHKFMVLLSVAILTHLDKPIPSNPVNGLFDQNFSHQERRFIAICLLRLLSLNSYYFEHEDDFRVKVFSLFDDVLSRDLYDKLGITQRLQTYVKSMKLKDAASIAELKMRENLDSLINFDRLDDYQGQFMKTINNSLVRAIIIPFLPRPLLYKARVSDLFDAIREYRQSSGSNIMEAYERASHITEQYLLEAQKYRTFYCKHYLSAIAERIIELLKKDFINSDVGQPAELVVNPLDKKYPFKQKDHALEIGFVIENRGTGHAFEVELSVYSLFDNIEFYRSTMHLGHLEPGSLIADFPAHVISSEEIALVEVTMNWHNADGSDKQVKVEYELKGQRTDIPWNDLVYEDPYSLEPVENYDDLIGRREKIDQLMRQCYAKSVGSSYIFGQKRVGKTSIAKALKSKLNQQDGFYPIYLEGGEYVHPDPKVTLSQLGVKLCENIKEYDKRLADLSIPKFEGALSPLTDFLKNVHELIPDLHILFILDEFDELPIDLYKRGSLADAFFLTLRTISGKPPFGIILIGGEKMEFIMSIQGDALNKFQAISVDYFDREKHWTDFQDLVRKPTIKWVEISDEAIVDLYKQTDGNPFYTMFVCKELFAMMVDRRDCHLTKREMKQAVQIALQKIRSNGFQHFWEDGVFEFTGDRVEEISIRRRRILIALANVLREKSKASKDDIEAQDVVYADVDFLESELRRFVQRGVLIQENNLYDCKVPFFRDWLKNYGVKDILITFSDLDTILERQQKEEEVYVRSGEIVDLISDWGLYKGRRITEDQVRAWLEQFGDYYSQRLMFRILQGLQFYSNDLMREKMKEAHGIVSRGLVWKIEKGERKRRDILISYLDGPGKSGGGKYAKLYADENEIYFDNVVERNKLTEVLKKRKDLQALVFIDDFIGTGGSAQDYFRQIAKESGQILRKADIKIYFVAVTGFQKSQHNLEKTIVECDLPIKVHICDPLDSSAKCFGENSQIFAESSERLQAMRIAQDNGAKIEKRNPLGFGDCQTIIVFPDSCPNNNLPILWGESTKISWRPLFIRQMPRKHFYKQ